MKKISISHQLIALFFSILAFSFGLIAILVFSRFQSVYRTETLERLESYIDGSRELWGRGADASIKPEDFEMAVIQGQIDFISRRILYSDDNYTDFISNQELTKIINDMHPGDKESRYTTGPNRNILFYAYEVEKNGNFIIVVTNASYMIKLRNNISSEVGLLFFGILAFAAVIIFLWSKGFIKRIHNIQEHVRDLPKNNYARSYNDGGNDEISDLAQSIEKMRIEIRRNESIKQEMLQNVSHDFKTPIAVIKSYAEAIEDNMTGPEASEIIINQADLLRKKVEKLLQYNRLEYLQKDHDFQEVNMKDVVENVVNNYKFQTSINIETSLENIYFLGYTENYYTIVDNILDNAKRYAKTIIKITLINNKLIIYNDGEHLGEQFLNGLFKPYEKGSKGQFGLGMSIVKKTLDFFNMNLDIRNEDVGVSFIISKK